MFSLKFFFVVSCISLTVSVLWIQLASSSESVTTNSNLVQEALKNVAKDYRYSDVYRKTSKLPKDLKYVLLWTPYEFAPFYYLGEGQKNFIKRKCSVINCYMTTDRNFFDGDLTKFDAIAFNGRNMKDSDLPKNRSAQQKYIYINMESSDNFPVCSAAFDGFFNWTSTYKLNSDVPYPYLLIRNVYGEIVGPKINMDWEEDLPEIDEELAAIISNKTKAAAWFVSHCKTRSKRQEFVETLQKALKPHGYNVDIYGKCGTMECPRNKNADCKAIIEKDYYFYMSLENSFAEDYVTEKLLTAVQHNAIPIVYGGANYSRYLPPGSYIDGRKYSTKELVELMINLMNNPKRYREYFKWKSMYTYHDPTTIENICAMCEALNNPTMTETESVYNEFRKWWLPNFKERCE